MERFENGSDISGFRSLNNSTNKTVLNLLEPVKLTVWKVIIEKVTVAKFRVNYGGGNDVLKSRYRRMQRSSIPFIDNGRTRRPLTPIKYMDKTVSTIDSDNTKEYI